MSFNEIKFQKVYPVLKSYVIPYNEDGVLLDLRELTDNDIETYKKVLEKLKKFVEESLKLLEQLGYRLNEVERIELIGDMISLYFRLPLLKEIFPSTILNPLKLYLFYRLWYRIYIPKDPIEFIENAFKDIQRLQDSDLFKMLLEEELSKDIEKVWFTVPADTRPGLNLSGLIPHLLLTSAISWILAVEGYFDREEMAMLRIASLLHDIGKPFNYREHPEISQNIAEIILKDLIPTDKVNEIKKIIATHHMPNYSDKYVDTIKEADRLSSTLDRVKILVEKCIGKQISFYSSKLGLNYESAFAAGKDSWDFWSKIVEKDEKGFKDLSIKFVEEIRKETENFTKPIKIQQEEVGKYSNIFICICDIAGIQKLISRSQEIKTTTAASYVIDSIVMAYLPIQIQKLLNEMANIWYPYESFLYTAGGICEFLLPSNIVHGYIDDVVKKLNEFISKYQTFVRFAYSETYNEMYTMLRELVKKLITKKYFVDSEPKYIEKHIIRNGSEASCNLCFMSSPSRKIQTVEGVKEVCESCYPLYKYGDQISFKERYESTIILKGKKYNPIKLYGNRDWNKINRYLIELIGGHSEVEIDALEVGKIERRNVAILKMDGNLMGPFIGTSISFTDLYERSARIDLALKKSIFKALEKIYESIGNITDYEEAAKQCFTALMGIFYAGGDDSLIALPSWLALPFSWIVGNEFRLNLGDVRGLAIGIAVGNAKANIWSLISAADELKTEAKRFTRNDPSNSSIMFDVADEATLNSSIVRSRLKYIENEKLTVQPLILGLKCDEIKEYVKLLFNISEYSELLELSYMLSRYNKNELLPESLKKNEDLMKLLEQRQKYAKDIRSVIQEIIHVTNKTIKIESPNKNFVAIKWFFSKFYACRQKVRFEGKEKERIYNVIIGLSPKKTIDDFLKDNVSRSDNASYLDADRLIKILGGGVL